MCFLSIILLNIDYQSEGLGTDYGSSWVRELTWALFPGGELFAPAPAPAATLRSESYIMLYDVILYYTMLYYIVLYDIVIL